jgi:hypothetical protein
LLSNLYDGVWTGNLKGGWLDEGVAHLYENRLFGEVSNWCYLTDEQLKPLKLGRFESTVANAVASDECPSFTSVASLDTVAMSPSNACSPWSYCDYLVRKQPGKLAAVRQDRQEAEARLGGDPRRARTVAHRLRARLEDLGQGDLLEEQALTVPATRRAVWRYHSLVKSSRGSCARFAARKRGRCGWQARACSRVAQR